MCAWNIHPDYHEFVMAAEDLLSRRQQDLVYRQQCQVSSQSGLIG